MTAHQQSKLNDLRGEYRAVTERKDSHSLSVFADCYDIAHPDRCVVCGGDEADHLGPRPGYDRAHHFRVAAPVATYRISPSGFVQRIDPVEQAA